MTNIIGTNANDALLGSESANTINGKAGNDTITGNEGDDTLTGGSGKDKFVYNHYSYWNGDTDIITDFGGISKGTNPTTAVITQVDTLIFQGAGLTARNLLLTQNGKNLEVTFEGVADDARIILQNFALENLDNLSKSTGATVDLGNILFDGQTRIEDSFDVFNANSTQSTIFNKNTVTFLNDLNNNVKGFDNSDDVINAQGGNDKIDGLSGNDLLRGGAGDNTLIGGLGEDNLNVNYSEGDNLLSGGDGNDVISAYGASGNNTLNGGAGDDILNNVSWAKGSIGDNLFSGGDGNDIIDISGLVYRSFYNPYDSRSSGNNTLNGGTGNDTLSAKGSIGDNLFSGGDGNDIIDISGFYNFISEYEATYETDSRSSGNNTLDGGKGNDTLLASGSRGDNLFSGGDGNDSFYVSTSYLDPGTSYLVTQTVNGGKGDDLLSVDHWNATEGITTIFNATTNIGSITVGTHRVRYNNIERLDILGTYYDDNLVGSNGNDTIDGGNSGNDTIDGGKGDDLLSYDTSYFATEGITTTFNATTNIGSITAGTNRVSYKNIERLNISGTQYDDNIVGSNGNDTLSGSYDGNDTIDGGKGDDLLFVDYRNSTGGITTIFNAIANIGSITVGTSQVSYKNIEALNISSTYYDDNIVGSNGNDTIDGNGSGNDTIDGGKGDDLLSYDTSYSSATEGITTTFNATTNIGSITTGTYRVSYKNIERLNILGTQYDDNIVGSNGNDTLEGGSSGNDTIIGGAGTDTFSFNSYGQGVDRLCDFNAINELIQVSSNDYSGFGGGLSAGSLLANEFTLGISAITSAQRFIYNDITGALYFDRDGSASGFTQVQFAQLLSGLSLTENNFVVV